MTQAVVIVHDAGFVTCSRLSSIAVAKKTVIITSVHSRLRPLLGDVSKSSFMPLVDLDESFV